MTHAPEWKNLATEIGVIGAGDAGTKMIDSSDENGLRLGGDA